MKSENGRSMVEMLGVLAIIGVLSVGAIAGYSKVMTKYKLNKQAEQISWLLNAMYRYKDILGEDKQWTSFVPYLKKLGEIPQEMIKDNSINLYDAFGLQYAIHTNGCSPICLYANLSINISNDYKNFDICNNIIETSKAFTEQLDHITVWQNKNDNTNAAFYVMGNARCLKNNKCLKNLNKNDIYNICQLCADKKGCSFNIQYLIKD
jgi:type II secretory pathway pseudopilin PulG